MKHAPLLIAAIFAIFVFSCSKKQTNDIKPSSTTSSLPIKRKADNNIKTSKITNDTFYATLSHSGHNEVHGVDTPIYMYVRTDENRLMHVTCNKVLESEFYGPITISFTFYKNDSNKYLIPYQKQYLKFSNDSLYFRWTYPDPMKNPNGGSTDAQGQLAGKKINQH